ncbi:MAG: hypothetical protein ABI670_09055 [Chloroflexota bacterium]
MFSPGARRNLFWALIVAAPLIIVLLALASGSVLQRAGVIVPDLSPTALAGATPSSVVTPTGSGESVSNEIIVSTGDKENAASSDCWTSFVLSGANAAVSELRGVAVLTEEEAWSVGYSAPASGDNQPRTTLIERWDGSRWSTVPSPNPAQWVNWLNGISAVSQDDVWAVGAYGNNSLSTLVVHWDGRTWTQVPSPNLASANNELKGVVAISAIDAWAVGYANITESISQPIIMHWDGKAWSLVPNLYTSTGADYLNGIAAVAAVAQGAPSTDIWAVGRRDNEPLFLHWDGSTWTNIPGTRPGLLAEMRAVAALKSDDVWAVGSEEGHTLIEHWDGTAWKIVPSPSLDLPGGSSVLRGVAVTGAEDVWAVGENTNSNNIDATLLHWDGQQWTNVSRTFQENSKDTQAIGLHAITVLNGSLWAVGATGVLGTENSSTDGITVRRASVSCAPLPKTQARILSGYLIGSAIATGHYLVWTDVNPNGSIYAHDLKTGRTEMIAGIQSGSVMLAADDGNILWVDQSSRIHVYDISAHTDLQLAANIASHGPNRYPALNKGVAFYRGVFYYGDNLCLPPSPGAAQESCAPTDGSIYTLELATGREKKVVERGQRPVVADGVLLWSAEPDSQPIAPEPQPTAIEETATSNTSSVNGTGDNSGSSAGSAGGGYSLHMLKLDGSQGDTVVSQAVQGGFSRYAVSADNIVWAGWVGADAAVRLYNIGTSSTKVISGQGKSAARPIIRGNKVVWVDRPNDGYTGGEVGEWIVQVFDFDTGSVATVLKERATALDVSALTLHGDKLLMSYRVGSPYGGLYLMDINSGR